MNKKLQLENLLKLLRNGTWTLKGEEVLAFHQVIHFIELQYKEVLEQNKEPVVIINKKSVKKGK